MRGVAAMHAADAAGAEEFDAGRAAYRPIAEQLRRRLLARMEEAGDAKAAIEPCWFPYS